MVGRGPPRDSSESVSSSSVLHCPSVVCNRSLPQHLVSDCDSMQFWLVLLFVVGAYDGFGITFVACDALELSFSGFACEMYGHLRGFVVARWKIGSTFVDVTHSQPLGIVGLLIHCGARALLFIAVPHCLHFSGIPNNPRGFMDLRAQVFVERVGIRDVCQEICDGCSCTFTWRGRAHVRANLV